VTFNYTCKLCKYNTQLGVPKEDKTLSKHLLRGRRRSNPE